jgi:uncharacterized Tic20 family protein
MTEEHQSAQEAGPETGPEAGAGHPGQGHQQDGEHERQTRQWAMFIHFSVLAGWVIPLAGVVVPVLLWQIKKDELPGIVPHAHVVLNWLVSSFVYGVICFILMFIFIGLIGFVVLGLATLVFSLYGGIKANEGELWEYPGTFIKLF